MCRRRWDHVRLFQDWVSITLSFMMQKRRGRCILYHQVPFVTLCTGRVIRPLLPHTIRSIPFRSVPFHSHTSINIMLEPGQREGTASHRDRPVHPHALFASQQYNHSLFSSLSSRAVLPPTKGSGGIIYRSELARRTNAFTFEIVQERKKKSAFIRRR